MRTHYHIWLGSDVSEIDGVEGLYCPHTHTSHLGRLLSTFLNTGTPLSDTNKGGGEGGKMGEKEGRKEGRKEGGRGGTERGEGGWERVGG